MLTKYRALVTILNRLPREPFNLARYVERCPPVGKLPLPEHTWAFIGSLHYYARCMRWGYFFLEVLRPVVAIDSRWVSLEERLGTNIVPGLPEWKCSVFGDDVFFAHEKTGECIHLCAWDAPEIISVHSLISHFKNHREPGPVEQRLDQLFPEGCGFRLALHPLFRNHLLTPVGDGNLETYRLARDYARLDEFVDLWLDPRQRVWLAAAIGDWPAAHAAAVDLCLPDVPRLTFQRAADCSDRWVFKLRQAVQRKSDSDARDARSWVK